MPNKKMHQGLNMNSNGITGLPVPDQTSDAATKAYVDSKAAPVQSVNTKTGDVVLSAGDISFTPTANTFANETDTVDEALKELFQSANSGKTAIANAIGSPITSANTFGEMATAIENAKTALDTFVDKAEGTTTNAETLKQLTDKLSDVRVFKSRTKLRKFNTETETIVLNNPIAREKLVASVLRLNGDALMTGVNRPSEFTAPFNNGDDNDFLPNSNITFENNRAEVKITTTTTALTNTTISDVKEVTLNLSNLNDTRITNITSSDITYQTLPTRQILIANDDIDISNVGDIKYIRFLCGASTNLNEPPSYSNALISGIGHTVRFALSFDSGATWYSNSGSSIQQFTDIANPSNINTSINYFNMGEIGNAEEFQRLRGNSNTLRFAYRIENFKIGYAAYLDQMEIEGYLKGQLEPAGTSATVSFNESTKTITVTFNATDTYQINWIDT